MGSESVKETKIDLVWKKNCISGFNNFQIYVCLFVYEYKSIKGKNKLKTNFRN